MKKIVYIIIIIIFIFSIFYVLEDSVENLARKQNNLNLISVSSCVEKELKIYGRTSKNLTSAMNLCAKDVRSLGITGDEFVIRVSDKKLFWDASVDCKPEEETKTYMTKDGVCSLFKNPQSCIDATNFMIANPPKGKLSWLFDDSTEYLNYMYLKEKINGQEYIIGQGTQKDEANIMFRIVYFLIALFGVALLIMTIML